MRATPLRRAAPVLLCLLCLAATLGGCRLPGKSVPPRPWLLSPLAGQPPADELSASLGVGPVELPGYLNRPEIVERVGPNELRANEFEVWGESLQTNFQDTLCQNLSQLVPGLAAVPFPWKGSRTTDYRLGVMVRRFEHDAPSGAVVLDARWHLLRLPGGENLAARARVYREPVQGRGAPAITAAMSRALAALSRDIGTDLAALPELGP